MSTILASTRDRQLLAASRDELDQARGVVSQLEETGGSTQLGIAHGDGSHVVLVPRELSDVVAQVLSIVARGGTVTVGSMPEELTTVTAAEQLGVSRPTLMKMIGRGEIPSHKVGTHTRVRTADVLAFRRARQSRRRQAFEELRALLDEPE